MRLPRIVLADDQALILEAIKNLLNREFEIVGTFSDGHALLHGAPELRPDLILLDINLPKMNGLTAGERLKEVLPRVKLVYLTMSLDANLASEAFRIGASAYVVKNSTVTELIHAIRLALLGRSYITPLITQDDLPQTFFRKVERNKQPNDLTLRQKEVMQLLAEGRSMKEVGYMLKLTPRTVAFHKYKIMRLLHLQNSSDLIRFALNNSIMAQA